MKIKEGYVLRKVGGRNIVVATGKACSEFNGMIRINDAGAFIWNRLSEDIGEEALVQAVVEKYEVDADTAGRDVSKFIKNLKEAGFLE